MSTAYLPSLRNIYTVGQVNAYIKAMFAEDFLLRTLTVRGEISNLKYHSSGHVYFTLKDAAGSLSCVCFKSDASRIPFRLKDGDAVHATGGISVYEKSGSYQLYVKSIELTGAGALYEQVEALKKKLADTGMFDEQYKRPLPKHVKTLGVVTASTGAAVRDIIQITGRRNPYVQIVLYPAQVQGEGAAESIVKGIEALNALPVDVMIVGRGGGSIEDLMAFNSEAVAEAIFNSAVPVISAVGHETDVTIADFAADLRAPTPSAAAELAVEEAERLEERLTYLTQGLIDAMDEKLASYRETVVQFAKSFALLKPDAKVREMRLTLDYLLERLQDALIGQVTERKRKMQSLAAQLQSVSPLQRLSAGYAYVQDEDARHVKEAAQLQQGSAVTLFFKDGRADANILKVVEETYGG